MACKVLIILIFYICIFDVISVHSQPTIDFSHITVEDGLSQNSILSITQDSNDFIWIGTMDGLNRLDGNKIKVYKSFYAQNSLGASLKINQLIANGDHNVWIGTNNGLYLYHSNLDSFQVFYHQPNSGLYSNKIKCLYKDKAGNIWVGTQNGLNYINSSKGTEYSIERIKINNAISNNVQAIHEDEMGRLWIGTDKGVEILSNNSLTATDLAKKFVNIPVSSIDEDFDHHLWIGSSVFGVYQLDPATGSTINFRADETVGSNLASNIVRRIRVDKKGKVWIGTLKGLTIYDPSVNKLYSYFHKPEDSNTLNYNSIYDLFEDKQGNMWVGAYFGGANIASSITTKFLKYKNEENKNSISSNVISTIIGDKFNNLWIGTEAEGVNYFDRSQQKFYRYKNNDKDTNSITSNLVKTILRDKDENIWIGLHNGLLERVSKERKKFEHFRIGDTDPASNSVDITALIEDDNGMLWIGKAEEGIFLFDKNEKTSKSYNDYFPNQTLSSLSITCLFEDRHKNIWIGTKHGLNVFKTSIKRIDGNFEKVSKGFLQSEYINCITQDKSGIIWIGTYHGLSYFDPVQNQFKSFNFSDGISGNKIIGIVVDDSNNLWISTNKGITRIDASRNRVNFFNKTDGLPENSFNFNSYYKDYQGHLFFGCFNGFVEFSPLDIKINSQAPKLVVTHFSINGSVIAARDSSGLLSKDISATQKIDLSYSQNILTINWAVLNFIKPGKNRSMYKLVGYNKDWMQSTDQSATFTNLPPGSYKLMLKGANNDGVWSNAVQFLEIVIHPPFWKTWWAYTLYIIWVFILFLIIFNFFHSRNKLKQKLELEYAINAQQQELHQMKMDFFTHISHEIRTPLTLIAGPVEMLLNNSLSATSTRKMLNSIKSNTDRLLKLTNDLLSFRKADSGFTQMQIQGVNIIAFAKTIFDKFNGKALHKDISYYFIAEESNVLVYIDREQIEIVLSNLLSNALKFTSAGGEVIMRIEKQTDSLLISVIDNGKGIPPESQDKIFTGYYQVKTGDDTNDGSGIGLAFSKRLMELHKGTISFTSAYHAERNMHETCFTVSFIIGTEHLGTKNI